MRVFHFMRYKWWFLGSLTAVTIFAFVTVFIVGLDLGIDFVGGVRMEVGLEKPATVDEVRSVVHDAGVQEPVVQSVTGASGTNSFMVTAEAMSEEQQKAILNTLGTRFGVTEGSVGVETVGASFGRETTNRAFIAVAIAVVIIIAYLSFRFEFKFAIPAIVALIHDVGLTLGIYAVSNRLVTSATVAAILTILGYSVHDTIIVFDRIRENTQLMKKETYGHMVDLSIRQTMVRSINTTICLLLPLVAILVFGGPTLKDFAFALTIGTLTGTYSSFFVAAPMLVIWKEREPRYRKRLLEAQSLPPGRMDEEGVATVPVAVAATGETVEAGDRRRPGLATPARGKASVKPPAKSAKQKTRKQQPGKSPKRTTR
jgi:SecD/SecF fusion protein